MAQHPEDQYLSSSPKARVLHGYSAETAEAKARWFQSLPLAERMDLLVAFTDLILENNPQISEIDHAQPTSGRVRVLRKEGS